MFPTKLMEFFGKCDSQITTVIDTKTTPDKYELELINVDKLLLNSQQENVRLLNKIKLLELERVKVRDISKILRKKDKTIYKLKSGLSLLGLRLNEELISKNYIRISRRFPHLNLEEIISFEKLVKSNGNSIQVHSGIFILTPRYTHDYNRSRVFAYEITWTCCHSSRTCNSSSVPKYFRYYIKQPNDSTLCILPPNPKVKTPQPLKIYHGKFGNHINPPCVSNVYGSLDLCNRIPNGKCDSSETFYLYEKDEKYINIDEVKIKYVYTAIETNIINLNKTAQEYLDKADNLNTLAETLKLIH